MTIEIGLARAIDAQAFGEPGNRTFRLRAIGEEGASVSLWLEKQQVQALDLALTQLLAQLGLSGEGAPETAAGFPESTDHEFKVGRMAVGMDTAAKAVTLYSFEISVPEDVEEPTLAVRLTATHCAGLRDQLQDIIRSGRPICPLCGVSIDPGGHMCIRANGHSTQPLPEDNPDEEP
jgi:uncharacterized repeat protein (TIGR03847 family)